MKNNKNYELKSEKNVICPNCGKEKPISEFGCRQDKDGKIKPQSWCNECRNKFARHKSVFKGTKNHLLKG